MEYRKIIEFGKSSYVVSIPKDWLAENKLQKGSTVGVCKRGKQLEICASTEPEEIKTKRITLDVTNMSKEEIKTLLISKYVMNFGEITITAENLPTKAADIRKTIHDLIALEVIEETSSRIVAKDFTNLSTISPFEFIRKMDNITREMIRDSKNSFIDDKSKNIAERDLDVNRLAHLIRRNARYLQENPLMARRLNMNHGQFMRLVIAAIRIENTANQAKRIAKLMRRVKLGKQEQKHFYKIYSAVEKYYIDGLAALYANDAEAALKLIMQKKKLIKQCRDFYRQNWNYEWMPVILEKLKIMAANTSYILYYLYDSE